MGPLFRLPTVSELGTSGVRRRRGVPGEDGPSRVSFRNRTLLLSSTPPGGRVR